MQFVVIAHDHGDAEALNRRMAARADHIALSDRMRDAGNLLYAAALLDEAERMVGSVMVLDFEAREELDDWLAREPYVVGNVWNEIDVKLCRVGPSFARQDEQSGVP